MKQENPLGLLDSGVGGLTIATQAIRFLPRENLIYYGDNLHLPYGTKRLSDVRRYVLRIVDYLVNEKKIKYLVFACNTATVAALELAREKYPGVPMVGPVDAGAKKAVQSSKREKIGILATEGTVQSGGYQNAILGLNPDAQIIAIPAPKLVPLVEQGELTGEEVEKTISGYLSPIMDAGCDTLILGCTHYPFLIKSLRKVIADQMDIIFPGKEIVLEIQEHLGEAHLLNPQSVGERIYVTSDLSKVSEEFLKVVREQLDMNLIFQEFNLFDQESM